LGYFFGAEAGIREMRLLLLLSGCNV